MSRIADRIPAATPLTLALAGCIALAAAQTPAQTAAAPPRQPAPASYSGCVQKAPGAPTTLILSTETACAKLTGKLSLDKLAGRQVELTGILTPRTPSLPASLQVSSIGSIGKSCTEVCSLQPPGTRGLHRPDSAVPGSEGGTPGVAPTPQQR